MAGDAGTALGGAMAGAMGGAEAGAAAGPWGALIGAAVGLGISAFGAAEQYSAAKQISGAETQIAQDEMQQDRVRRQMMELTARRESMQVLRNTQMARSQGLTNATGKGAQFGSGLAGGQAQESDEGGINLLNIGQNKQAGEQMFNLSDQINQQKMIIAKAGGTAALGQGLSGLGQGITNVSMSPFTQNLFGSIGI